MTTLRTPTPRARRASRIARAFGEGAAYYDLHARVQREAADRLADRFTQILPTLPGGPLLEVGCGTGFLTRRIVAAGAGRPIEITDLSPEMVAFARERFEPQHERVRFRVADAEAGIAPGSGYAAILAGFVAQWFEEPGPTLARLASALVPGGALLASLPVAGSFPEWREAAERAGVPFPEGALPEVGEIVAALDAEVAEMDLVETHPSPLEFFRHLKQIGAATRVEGEPLPAAAFRALLQAWGEGPARVTYRSLFLVVRRRHG